MKICVVRIDKMGDMLLTLPIIQGLKKANEKNIIDVVCSDNNLKSEEELPKDDKEINTEEDTKKPVA